jgi:hypothetical protein
MEKELKPTISPENLAAEACAIIEKATYQGLVLRILGGLAVRIHSEQFLGLYEQLDRKMDTADVDAVTYNKYQNKLEPFFKQIDFTPDPSARRTPVIWGSRQIYIDPNERFHVDIFFDKLEMSHTIDLRHRLEADKITVPIADILLGKMQIHQINEKDIKDAIVLIRAHELGDSDGEQINERYVAKLMSEDWGFYHTVTANLEKTKLLLNDYKMNQADKEDVSTKITRLLTIIENEPKNTRFKLRAGIGEKKKWYNEVDETFKEEQEWQ